MGWAHEIGLALDPRADVALGVQLDWGLRAAVSSGTLRPGDRLPALRDLATELGVNHNTVRAAVARLEADGVLETRHGAGTFVAPGARPSDVQAPLLDQVVRLASDAGLTPRDLAAALYVSGQEPPEPDTEAAERRAMRAEIAVLDRVLAEIEARLPAPLPEEFAVGSRGPRLLSADELRAQRDALVRRLAAAHRMLEGDGEDEQDPSAQPAAEPPRAAARQRPAPRPGVSPA
jgi:DNA-binding FadR family transcriptional regulator